jgi:hypothetical protein
MPFGDQPRSATPDVLVQMISVLAFWRVPRVRRVREIGIRYGAAARAGT